MEKGYTILEHPSDLGIEAHGETMNVAFEQAATALMSVMLDPTTVDGLEQRHVEIAAVDAEQLLVKWLTEILYLYDGQQFAAKRFTIERLTPTALAAMIAGEHVSPEKHITRLDVKAVTYHQLSVAETGDGVRVRVFLDI